MSHDISIVVDLLRRQEARLSAIESRLDGIQGSAARMDDHIDFFNSAYMFFQRPMMLAASAVQKFAPMLGLGPPQAPPQPPTLPPPSIIVDEDDEPPTTRPLDRPTPRPPHPNPLDDPVTAVRRLHPPVSL